MLTFNVVLIGPSGAGKSTFFSSMNETLGNQRLSDSFFVRPDPATKNRLACIYQKMSDTGQNWPARNHCDDMVELLFTGCLDSTSETLELYEIRYLDYDGRCLADQHIDSRLRKSLAEKIKESDALLCVLDGERVTDLLKNEAAGRRFFEHEMAAIWEHLSSYDSPLHFVVTKWDLVEQYGNLKAVGDALMQVHHFASVVRRVLVAKSGLDGRRIVRLIPVSAVGNGFAVPSPDGNMAKVSGSTTSPLNTSIPFFAVLPDLLQTAIRNEEKNAERVEKSKFLKNIQENFVVQSLAGAGAQRSLQKVLTQVPAWTHGALGKLGQFARSRGRDEIGQWIADHGARIGDKPVKHSGFIASGLVFLTAVAVEVLKKQSNDPIDPETWRKHSAALDQAVRAYKLELDRFREQYPASHLADLDLSPGQPTEIGH